MKKKDKRVNLKLPKDLHERIKKAAQQNNRKIVDELKERFPIKKER